MKYSFDGVSVEYACIGSGQPLILLHGWGGSAVWAQFVGRLAELGFQVFVIDMPGFGGSDTPGHTVDSDWYAELIAKFCGEMEINNPVIMGHSLGGKVAIISHVKHGVGDRLILVDSAGFKRFYIKVYLKMILAKAGKSLLGLLGDFGREMMRRKILLNKLGSADYLAAGKMRESFRKIIGEDIRALLPDVEAETLIIWGDRDNETPLIDGVQMNRLIPNSKLRIIEKAGHFPFVSHGESFFKILQEYFDEQNI